MNTAEGRITMVREHQVQEALKVLISSSQGLNRWSCFSRDDLSAIKRILEDNRRDYHPDISSVYAIFIQEIESEMKRQWVERDRMDSGIKSLEETKHYVTLS
jgi:hypothetical protein